MPAVISGLFREDCTDYQKHHKMKPLSAIKSRNFVLQIWDQLIEGDVLILTKEGYTCRFGAILTNDYKSIDTVYLTISGKAKKDLHYYKKRGENFKYLGMYNN